MTIATALPASHASAATAATDPAAPDWRAGLPPTREAALARIARVRPADYARTRNHLQGAVTGLSPYLTHGLVTLPEVLAGVLARGPLPAAHKLVDELGWRAYFRHVWSHRGDGILQSLHEGPRPEAAYARQLPADIRTARTGVPVVDQAVRQLYATGTLHNHARMWLASYVVHLRQVHWRAGADWLVAHLLDGDLASNHLSWQWIAGTGSHKPYLFNADNVARFAPPAWHSPGTVVDRSYEDLERIARGQARAPATGPAAALAGIDEPKLHATPPAAPGLRAPDASDADRLRGRTVWLVHPWALRPPPAGLPAGTVVLGVYLREAHAGRPWPLARWQWVDAAMAAVAPQRWSTDAAGLAAALAGAAQVHAVDDPHIGRRLPRAVRLAPEPALFPAVERPCGSWSQWRTRALRGIHDAAELL
jgi:deoxyribodipyrimidine photo-lyase